MLQLKFHDHQTVPVINNTKKYLDLAFVHVSQVHLCVCMCMHTYLCICVYSCVCETVVNARIYKLAYEYNYIMQLLNTCLNV